MSKLLSGLELAALYLLVGGIVVGNILVLVSDVFAK